MPIYLVTNRVSDGFTPGAEAFAAWAAWFDGLGDAVADRGHPAFASTVAGNAGAGTALGGYTLVMVGSLDDALGLVADHPLLACGGGVEVAELTVISEGIRLRSGAGFTVTTSVHVAPAHVLLAQRHCVRYRIRYPQGQRTPPTRRRRPPGAGRPAPPPRSIARWT